MCDDDEEWRTEAIDDESDEIEDAMIPCEDAGNAPFVVGLAMAV